MTIPSTEDIHELFDALEPSMGDGPDAAAIIHASKDRRERHARIGRGAFAAVIIALFAVVGLTLLSSDATEPTTVTDDGTLDVLDESSPPVSETATVDVENQPDDFFEILQQGDWRLAEASETFPDRDFADQGIKFFSLVEPADRMGFNGGECFGVHMFLRWEKPGLAIVTPNETGLDVARAELPCDRTPGIANYPAPFGSTVRVELSGVDTINVRLADRHSRELWDARFELQPYTREFPNEIGQQLLRRDGWQYNDGAGTIDRAGISYPSDGSDEGLRFSTDETPGDVLTLVTGCKVAAYRITWNQDGFIVDSIFRGTKETTLEACDFEATEGLVVTPFTFGEQILVQRDDYRVTLTPAEPAQTPWTIWLS